MVAGGDLILAEHVNILIGEAVVTSSTTLSQPEVEVNTITVPLVNGYTYELRMFAHLATSTANTVGTFRIRNTTVAGTEITNAQIFAPTTSSLGFQLNATPQRFTAAATGNQVFKMTLTGNTSTNQVQVAASALRPCRLQVWRIVNP
jgi:hypothetical protein